MATAPMRARVAQGNARADMAGATRLGHMGACDSPDMRVRATSIPILTDVVERIEHRWMADGSLILRRGPWVRTMPAPIRLLRMGVPAPALRLLVGWLIQHINELLKEHVK